MEIFCLLEKLIYKMFTGIVEEIGKIKKIKENDLVIECKKVIEGSNIGDSISVSGICLTITSITDNSLHFQLTEETKSKTFFGFEFGIEKSTVNLERAASYDKRIGGHLLEGHIEGIAVCKKINVLKNSNEVIFETDKNIIDNIVEKGYIGIDGTSITIVSIDNNQFAISLIPHTMNITTLGHLSKNQIVNIETDINARYIRKYVEQIMKN